MVNPIPDLRTWEVEGDQEGSSSLRQSVLQAEPPVQRTGKEWTAVAHIITGVIGSGVLSLAWGVARLGWVAGPLAMLVYASVTFASAFSLCNCYRFPNPESGPSRNTSYLQAVRMILGKRSAAICGIFLRINFFKVGVVYTITSAISLRAIQKSNCYHREGQKAACEYGLASYMLFFGITQAMVSQIPSFRKTKWLSVIAAIMSFYSTIGSTLSLAKAIGDGKIKGSVGGAPTSTSIQKLWLVSQALGNIAFAFPFSVILIEIQDTLKPPELVTMKKASTVAISITTFFYLCCGGFGYAAFGDSAPGNILTGFGFYEPYWLIDFANACVILHLIGGYQKEDVLRCGSNRPPNSMVGPIPDLRTREAEGDQERSSSFRQSVLQAEPPVQRTGKEWTAVAHIITGVIGSGVLSLAWGVAQLGWVAGPLAMLVYASVTFASAFSLCNCYRSPNPESGPSRNTSYLQSVRMILGKRSAAICGIFLRINFFKVGVVYTITSAISLRAIQKSNCYHREGQKAACEYGLASYMLFFGIAQVMVSQIPSFRKTKWLSVIAAIMSFSYSTIGSTLSLAKAIGDGKIKGSVGGAPTSTSIQKLWLVSQALGNIAFAFPFSVILIEIQDTLKPPELVTMKEASTVAISITTFFYLCCGGFGYAAFGDSAPGNILTGFGFYEPYWLIDFANACVILHLIGGYQVFSQPLYADLEGLISAKFPNSGFVNKNYKLKVPLLKSHSFRVNLLRLCFRTAYVGLTTGIAVAFPYFNQIVGVAGAVTFWPLVVFFPTEMYISQRKIGAWTRKWVAFRVYTFICLIVTLFALVGSLQSLIKSRFS